MAAARLDFEPGIDHFLAAGPALGNESMDVEIAGLTIRFAGLWPALKEASLDQYGPFLADFGSKPYHVVTLHEGARSYLNPAPDLVLRFSSRTFPEGEVLTSLDFSAMRSDTRGRLLVSASRNENAVLGAMENYLRWTMANLALSHEAFVLHSAGVVKQSRAYIFFGHSGAGKSTVASLSTGGRILSDDLVLLQRQPDGVWNAVTTPFAGSFPQRKKATGAFPLAGLYHLNHAKHNRLVKVNPPIAAALLLSCCPFISAEERSGLLLPLITNLCSTVQVFRLEFRRDSSFWEMIDLQRSS